MDLIVPAPFEGVILGFNSATTPFDVHDVQRKLGAVRPTLKGLSDAERRGEWAEILAFALSGSEKAESPWKTFFGPIGSGIRADGTHFYSPDISGTEPVIWSHWCQRARDLTHPVLKARYADLAWDMALAVGNQRRDALWAITAIDAYLSSLAAIASSDEYRKFDTAIRALDLAVTIRDDARTDLARQSLMELHRGSLRPNDGLWWRAFDRLVPSRRARTTAAEIAELVSDLERLLSKFSNVANSSDFNPHAAESAAGRLLKHYSRNQDSLAAKRVNAIVGSTFEHFAGMGDSMLASMVLQTSVNAFRKAGQTEDAERVRIMMQSKIERSRHEMKRVETSFNVPKEDVEKFLESVVVPELGSTFARIASSFVSSRTSLEAQVQETLTHAPLMARLGQDIVSGDRVVAKLGSVEEDPFGRLLHHASTVSGLEAFWLDRALIRLRETHDVTPEHIVGWANRRELFPDAGLLLEGVYAWFEGDFAKTIHVLVPQIENGLRHIVAQLNKPTTKAHPSISGASVAIGMGDMLYLTDVTAALGPDLTLYFQIHYTDPRGRNLRNELAHGLISYGAMNAGQANWLIHTLLVFGVWDQLAQRESLTD